MYHKRYTYIQVYTYAYTAHESAVCVLCARAIYPIYNKIRVLYYALYDIILCVHLALASTRVIYKLDLSSVSFHGAVFSRGRVRCVVVVVGAAHYYYCYCYCYRTRSNNIIYFAFAAYSFGYNRFSDRRRLFYSFPVIFIVLSFFFLSTRYIRYNMFSFAIHYYFRWRTTRPTRRPRGVTTYSGLR